MWPDRVSNLAPLTYESGTLPTSLRGPASYMLTIINISLKATETKAKMVWPCLKVFWFSKDNPTGHSERKKKKKQTEKEVGRQYERVDRNGLCQLN